MMIVAQPALTFVPLFEPIIHHNCVRNQLVGLSNRVLGGAAKPHLPTIKNLFKVARRVARELPPCQQQELGDFALAYSGAKRTRYLDAAEEVKNYGLTKRDARVTAFVKNERIDPTAKTNPDPRIIQFRDAKYCVVLASYLKPLEHALYELVLPSKYLGQTRLVGKGLNQKQRAELFITKFHRHNNPVCLSLDVSRFDKNVSKPLLKVEHSVYTAKYPESKELAKILKWQLNDSGTTGPLVYHTEGRRKSGDMNTALGNCVIMIVCVVYSLEKLGIPFDVLDDGDDCLVIVDELHFNLVKATLLLDYPKFGMPLKIEGISRSLSTTTWCQCNLIQTAEGPKFIRNPRKIMSTSLVGQAWVHLPPHVRWRRVRAIGECELVLNRGVPVLQHYALALLRNAGRVDPLHQTTSGEYVRYMRELKSFVDPYAVVSINSEARLSFSKAFGLTVEQQLATEQELDQWEFDVGHESFDSGSISPDTWLTDYQLFPTGNE